MLFVFDSQRYSGDGFQMWRTRMPLDIAFIDANGTILHPGDLPRQLDRTLENIEALLAEAGTTLDAMQVFTVYLRHESDRARYMRPPHSA